MSDGDTHPVTTSGGRLGRAHGTGMMWRAGRGVISAMTAAWFGLPIDGAAVEAELTVQPIGAGDDSRPRRRSAAGGDRWTRRFGRRRWTTECTPTADGFVEWLGPGHLLGVELVGGGGSGRATLRLASVRVGSRRIGRPLGLRIDAAVDAMGDALGLVVVASVAGRTVLAYEGWIR